MLILWTICFYFMWMFLMCQLSGTTKKSYCFLHWLQIFLFPDVYLTHSPTMDKAKMLKKNLRPDIFIFSKFIKLFLFQSQLTSFGMRKELFTDLFPLEGTERLVDMVKLLMWSSLQKRQMGVGRNETQSIQFDCNWIFQGIIWFKCIRMSSRVEENSLLQN